MCEEAVFSEREVVYRRVKEVLVRGGEALVSSKLSADPNTPLQPLEDVRRVDLVEYLNSFCERGLGLFRRGCFEEVVELATQASAYIRGFHTCNNIPLEVDSASQGLTTVLIGAELLADPCHATL